MVITLSNIAIGTLIAHYGGSKNCLPMNPRFVFNGQFVTIQSSLSPLSDDEVVCKNTWEDFDNFVNYEGKDTLSPEDVRSGATLFNFELEEEYEVTL